MLDKKYIVSDVMFGYLMTHNPQYMGDDWQITFLWENPST